MSDETSKTREPWSPQVQEAMVNQCGRYQAAEKVHHRTIDVLIAAGFLTREKYEEARSLVESLP